jgi:hypothetical protein
MRVLRLIAVFIILGFLPLSSCSPVASKSPLLETAIVGRWRQVGGPSNIQLFKDGSSTMQFFKEGTVIISGGTSVTAWYDFPEDYQIRIQPKYGPKGGKEFGIIFQVSVGGDYLTLTDPSGNASAKFQRQE